MAVYGRDNLNSFMVANTVLDNLQHYLDRDTGIAFPYPAMKFLPNLGEGGVLDDTPPHSKETHSVTGDSEDGIEVVRIVDLNEDNNNAD